jgi:hypothetical protein
MAGTVVETRFVFVGPHFQSLLLCSISHTEWFTLPALIHTYSTFNSLGTVLIVIDLVAI